MTAIPGLPPELRRVPPTPDTAEDPEAEEKRAAYWAWRTGVLRWRTERAAWIGADETRQQIERAKCATHPAYFLAAWGWIFEPRAERGQGDKPFLPFSVQVDLLDFFLTCLATKGAQGDGVVSKSRDMGASWIMAAFALWGWLFERPWQVRLISYKEELVDKGYNKQPDSLFWKIDYLLDRLPPWMRPAGYDVKQHRQVLFMQHPTNGNVIAGQSSTSKSGRAARATWIGFDEFAFFEDGDDSYSATANTTEHRFVVSSESLEHGDHFYRLRTGDDEHPDGPRAAVFEMDYYAHPGHDAEWREDMKARYQAAGRLDAFYREVDRNPHAGTTSWVYPEAWDKQTDPTLGYHAADASYVGLDPGWRNASAVVWAQERPDGFVDVLDGYMNVGRPAEFYGGLMTGRMVSGFWDYTEEELLLAEWAGVFHQVGATYFGDVYGDNIGGATMDSFYSVLLEKFAIRVNADRRKINGEERPTAYQMRMRTHPGRQEALHELMPRLRFADTPGARRVLKAIKHYQNAPDDRPRTSEPKSPLIDGNSHFASTMEYIAVHLKMRKSSVGRVYKPAQRARLLPALPQPPRWQTDDRLVIR